MSNQPNKKQTGKVNYMRVLAGFYLLYTAYKLVHTVIDGEADNNFIVMVFVLLFAVVGAVLMFREWRSYKYGMEHIDDPTSWSDEMEDEELSKLIAESKTTVEAGSDATAVESSDDAATTNNEEDAE